jgi:glycosyltransferase involved in cell wall biosynthesis
VTPAVSVIVPCHNGGRFLDGLVANLREQTFQDLEVVIVNNGSTEQDTIDVLTRLESLVRVVHQENRYLPGARNRGFKEARADIVLPLDCDDRLEPTFLAETLAALRSAPPDVGFVFTHMRLTGSVEGILHTHCNRFDQLFLNHMAYCLLTRKSAWEKIGGYDETMRDGTEDWEFNIRLIKAGYKWIEVPKPLFLYAVRADGMLLSKSARMHATIWKRIRDRNPELYRLPALIRTWRDNRPSWFSTLRGTALLTLAAILPEAWCNKLFFRLNMFMRRRRIAQGELRVIEA